MSESSKAPEKRAPHPQVEALKESIAKREERVKSAKGDEKTAQEAVIATEKASLVELQKYLTK